MLDLLETIEQAITLTPEEMQEAEKAYQALLPLATALDESSLIPFRRGIDFAKYNAIICYQEVKKLEPNLKNLIKIDAMESVDRIPAIALASSFICLKVNNLSKSYESGTIRLLEQARTLRRRLLKSAEACAEYELVSSGLVENIKKGKGSRDIANDCVALASLFRENKAALVGATPVRDEDIEQSAIIGSKLQALLKPSGASTSTEFSEVELELYDLRDRFWTLLVQHRDAAWRLGALVLGEQKIAELVPALLSRERSKTPNTPEVKQAKQEAKVAKDAAALATQEAKEKAKAAAKISKDARQKR